MSRHHRSQGGEHGHGHGAEGHAPAAAGGDAITQGHLAVQNLEGSTLFPRISLWAAHAIETGNFRGASEAAMRWYKNRPHLRTLAQSLDPSDRFVARAQALLDDMAPLEARLPAILEIGFGDDGPRGRARWLARIGRAEKPERASAKAAPLGVFAMDGEPAVEANAGERGTRSSPEPARAGVAESRAALKLELTGLAGLFRLYQRHRDTAALETAYATNTVNDGSGLAPDTSQSDAASRELEAALHANGFADVHAFEALVRQYERDFEAGAAEVVLAMLERYKTMLSAEATRYRSREAVDALHKQLGGFRGHHRAEEAAVAEHGKAVMRAEFSLVASRSKTDAVASAGHRVAEAEALASQDLDSLSAIHPVLRDDGLPDSRRLDRSALAAASAEQLGPMLERHLAQRLADIAQVRALVASNPGAVYKMDRLFPQFYAALGIATGSVFDLIVQDKRHRDAAEKILDAVGLAVLATALSVASFGTATPALAAAAGTAGAGVGVYTAYQDYQAYGEQNDLADVGFTSRGSVGWLIVSFVGAGLDVGGAASAVHAAKTANAIRVLAPAAEAIDAGGDLADFTKAVHALEAAGELDARAARAAERAAAARAELAAAARDLVGATSGKLNAILGPFTDPAVYKAIFNLAKGTWRAGFHTAEEFFENLRKARAQGHRRPLARGARHRQAGVAGGEGRRGGRRSRGCRAGRRSRHRASPARFLGSGARRGPRARAAQRYRPQQAGPCRHRYPAALTITARRRSRAPPARPAYPWRQRLRGHRPTAAVDRRAEASAVARRVDRRRAPSRVGRHDQADLVAWREVTGNTGRCARALRPGFCARQR